MQIGFPTGCPNKHGNSVTISISSLLWIGIGIPNFKSHNIMSARVFFMKTVYNVSASTTVCNQNINKLVLFDMLKKVIFTKTRRRKPWIGFIKNVKNTTNENGNFLPDIQCLGIFEYGLFSNKITKHEDIDN